MAVCLGITGITNILLNLSLIPLFGIEGAAIGTVLSFILLFIILILIVKNYYDLSFRNLDIKIIIILIITLLSIGITFKVYLKWLYSFIIVGVIFLVISILLIHITKPLWYNELLKYIKSILKEK